MLYAVSAIAGILLGLAAAQVTDLLHRPLRRATAFPVWQSGVIGLAGAVVVVIACALLDEEFIPVTRQWLRAAAAPHLRRRSQAAGELAPVRDPDRPRLALCEKRGSQARPDPGRRPRPARDWPGFLWLSYGAGVRPAQRRAHRADLGRPGGRVLPDGCQALQEHGARRPRRRLFELGRPALHHHAEATIAGSTTTLSTTTTACRRRRSTGNARALPSYPTGDWC